MDFENRERLIIYYNLKIKQDHNNTKKKIYWGSCCSPIGKILIIIHKNKIIKLDFINEEKIFENAKKIFKEINIKKNIDKVRKIRDIIFYKKEKIKIELTGTQFQLKVWKNVINTNSGELLSYSEISKRIKHNSSQRAVANALKLNKIGFLVPCHRIIQKSGKLGGFKWGQRKKQEIIDYERGFIKSY